MGSSSFPFNNRTNAHHNICSMADIRIVQVIKQFHEHFELGKSGDQFVVATASKNLAGHLLPLTYSFYYDAKHDYYEMDRTATFYNFKAKHQVKETERYQISPQGEILSAWKYAEAPMPDMKGFIKNPNIPIESCSAATGAMLKTLEDMLSPLNLSAKVHTFLY